MFELIPFERRNYRAMTFDPFREMAELERRFWGNDRAPASFRTDVIDNGDGYTLEAELPGFSKDEIALDLDNDCLTITAEHSSESKTDERAGYLKRERYYGSYTRSFDVTGIDTDNIDAAYADGVLTVTMPKKPEQKPVGRRLEIR